MPTIQWESDMIETRIHDDVLEITLSNPPVNALGAAVRQGIVAALGAAQANDAIVAIVIRGAGRLFCAGADITEFDKPIVLPMLPEVVDAIEASAKPVVAAIHGVALGGGLEIALGAHYRIATPSAKFGLPEVKLGILPGAGGTQRLPRIVGIEASLNMITSGNPITAAEAQAVGLIDRIVKDDEFADAAIAYARTLREVRRTGERPVLPDFAAFARFEAANARRIKGLDAPAACIEAVRAATVMSLAEGMHVEAALFMKLVHGDQARALRHLFFAERAAATVDDMPKNIQVRPIERVGIIGAGTMGVGIAMNFLSAGLPVTIVDTSAAVLDRGVGIVGDNYQASVAKGRLTAEKVERAMGLLTATTDFDRLGECDLVIEAVYEDIAIKKDIFTRLDVVAKPGAILASNTSYLSIDEIALSTSRPQDVIGLHFFSPANIMTLLEVVRGARTGAEVLATCMSIAKRIGKVPVIAGVCYGFIGNRMLIPRFEQAFSLLNEGASPEQVDRVNTQFGLPMGPFQMADLSGTDIGWHRDPSRIDNVREALCAKGRLGQKAKAGFYDYDDQRRARSSPEVASIIEDFRRSIGAVARPISDEEILVRTVYTMINEGAKIVEEGIAQRPSDIDVVYVHGYGWPRHMGGPMFWGDRVGAGAVVDALEKYRRSLGPDFAMAPLLQRAASGGTALAEIAR